MLFIDIEIDIEIGIGIGIEQRGLPVINSFLTRIDLDTDPDLAWDKSFVGYPDI